MPVKRIHSVQIIQYILYKQAFKTWVVIVIVVNSCSSKNNFSTLQSWHISDILYIYGMLWYYYYKFAQNWDDWMINKQKHVIVKKMKGYITNTRYCNCKKAAILNNLKRKKTKTKISNCQHQQFLENKKPNWMIIKFLALHLCVCFALMNWKCNVILYVMMAYNVFKKMVEEGNFLVLFSP